MRSVRILLLVLLFAVEICEAAFHRINTQNQLRISATNNDYIKPSDDLQIIRATCIWISGGGTRTFNKLDIREIQNTSSTEGSDPCVGPTIVIEDSIFTNFVELNSVMLGPVPGQVSIRRCTIEALRVFLSQTSAAANIEIVDTRLVTTVYYFSIHISGALNGGRIRLERVTAVSNFTNQGLFLENLRIENGTTAGLEVVDSFFRVTKPSQSAAFLRSVTLAMVIRRCHFVTEPTSTAEGYAFFMEHCGDERKNSSSLVWDNVTSIGSVVFRCLWNLSSENHNFIREGGLELSYSRANASSAYSIRGFSLESPLLQRFCFLIQTLDFRFLENTFLVEQFRQTHGCLAFRTSALGSLTPRDSKKSRVLFQNCFFNFTSVYHNYVGLAFAGNDFNNAIVEFDHVWFGHLVTWNLFLSFEDHYNYTTILFRHCQLFGSNSSSNLLRWWGPRKSALSQNVTLEFEHVQMAYTSLPRCCEHALYVYKTDLRVHFLNTTLSAGWKVEFVEVADVDFSGGHNSLSALARIYFFRGSQLFIGSARSVTLFNGFHLEQTTFSGPDSSLKLSNVNIADGPLLILYSVFKNGASLTVEAVNITHRNAGFHGAGIHCDLLLTEYALLNFSRIFVSVDCGSACFNTTNLAYALARFTNTKILNHSHVHLTGIEGEGLTEYGIIFHEAHTNGADNTSRFQCTRVRVPNMRVDSLVVHGQAHTSFSQCYFEGNARFAYISSFVTVNSQFLRDVSVQPLTSRIFAMENFEILPGRVLLITDGSFVPLSVAQTGAVQHADRKAYQPLSIAFRNLVLGGLFRMTNIKMLPGSEIIVENVVQNTTVPHPGLGCFNLQAITLLQGTLIISNSSFSCLSHDGYSSWGAVRFDSCQFDYSTIHFENTLVIFSNISTSLKGRGIAFLVTAGELRNNTNISVVGSTFESRENSGFGVQVNSDGSAFRFCTNFSTIHDFLFFRASATLVLTHTSSVKFLQIYRSRNAPIRLVGAHLSAVFLSEMVFVTSDNVDSSKSVVSPAVIELDRVHLSISFYMIAVSLHGGQSIVFRDSVIDGTLSNEGYCLFMERVSLSSGSLQLLRTNIHCQYTREVNLFPWEFSWNPPRYVGMQAAIRLTGFRFENSSSVIFNGSRITTTTSPVTRCAGLVHIHGRSDFYLFHDTLLNITIPNRTEDELVRGKWAAMAPLAISHNYRFAFDVVFDGNTTIIAPDSSIDVYGHRDMFIGPNVKILSRFSIRAMGLTFSQVGKPRLVGGTFYSLLGVHSRSGENGFFGAHTGLILANITVFGVLEMANFNFYDGATFVLENVTVSNSLQLMESSGLLGFTSAELLSRMLVTLNWVSLPGKISLVYVSFWQGQALLKNINVECFDLPPPSSYIGKDTLYLYGSFNHSVVIFENVSSVNHVWLGNSMAMISLLFNTSIVFSGMRMQGNKSSAPFVFSSVSLSSRLCVLGATTIHNVNDGMSRDYPNNMSFSVNGVGNDPFSLYIAPTVKLIPSVVEVRTPGSSDKRLSPESFQIGSPSMCAAFPVVASPTRSYCSPLLCGRMILKSLDGNLALRLNSTPWEATAENSWTVDYPSNLLLASTPQEEGAVFWMKPGTTYFPNTFVFESEEYRQSFLRWLWPLEDRNLKTPAPRSSDAPKRITVDYFMNSWRFFNETHFHVELQQPGVVALRLSRYWEDWSATEPSKQYLTAKKGNDVSYAPLSWAGAKVSNTQTFLVLDQNSPSFPEFKHLLPEKLTFEASGTRKIFSSSPIISCPMPDPTKTATKPVTLTSPPSSSRTVSSTPTRSTTKSPTIVTAYSPQTLSPSYLIRQTATPTIKFATKSPIKIFPVKTLTASPTLSLNKTKAPTLHTLALNVTVNETTPPSTPAPTPPPAPPAGVARVSATLEKVVSKEVAAAATTTAATAAAIGGAVSPGSANKASNMAQLLSTLQCEFTNDDLEISPAQVWVMWHIGEGKFAQLLGPIVSCTAFTAVIVATNYLVFTVAPAQKNIRLALGLLSSVVMSYFLPTVVSMASLLLFHAEGSMFILLFSVGALVAVLVITAVPLVTVLRSLVDKNHNGDVKLIPETNKWNLPEPSTLAFGLRYFYDIAARPTELTSAMVFFEDLFVAFAMAFVGSIRPPSQASCWIIACALALLSLLHVGYLLFLRPIRTKLDTVFAVTIAVLQAAVAVLVLIATQVQSVLPIVGYVSLALGFSFAVQTVVMFSWTLYLFYRRRQKKQAEKAKIAEVLKKRREKGISEANDESEVPPALHLPLLEEEEEYDEEERKREEQEEFEALLQLHSPAPMYRKDRKKSRNPLQPVRKSIQVIEGPTFVDPQFSRRRSPTNDRRTSPPDQHRRLPSPKSRSIY